MVGKPDVKRVNGIDGIKGLAIMAIIFYHLLPNKVPGGFLGVDIFLMLSGYFSMSVLMYPKNQTIKSYIRYIGKQLSKLWAPLWVMCLFVVGYATVFQQQALPIIRKTFVPSVLFFNNWWQIITGASYFDTGYNQSPLTHLWYVALNMQLYILLAFILFVFKKRQQQALLGVVSVSVLLMGILFLVTNDINRVYYGLDTRAFSFFLGALLASMYPKKMFLNTIVSHRKIHFYVLAVLFFVTLCLFVLLQDDKSAFLYCGGFFLFDIVFAMFLVTSVHRQTLIDRLLGNPLLKSIGIRSYVYYLWYYPVNYFYSLSVSSISEWVWLHVFLQCVIIVVLSEVSYRLFKRLHWKKFLVVLSECMRGSASLKEMYKWLLTAGLSLVVVVLNVIGLFLITAPENTSAAKLKQAIESNQQAIESEQQSVMQTQTTSLESTTQVNQDEYVAGATNGLTEQEVAYAKQLPVTFLGDSVLLISADSLKRTFPNAIINGKVSRQFYESTTILEEMKAQQQLHQTIVIVLGSNGIIKHYQAEEVIRNIGANSHIYFVNNSVPRTWQNENNAVLQTIAQTYEYVNVIDWHDFVKSHPEWLYEDLVHPNEIGAEKLTELIAKEIYKRGMA